MASRDELLKIYSPEHYHSDISNRFERKEITSYSSDEVNKFIPNDSQIR